jgi:hypothetical protein
MSLKAFHLVFISAATLLALGYGAWELNQYWSAGRQALDLAFGLGSVAAGAGLVVYERYFLKKLRKVSYL